VGVKPSPEHFLLSLNCSRVNHGSAKGALGYDPSPQRYWDTAWSSLTEAAALAGLRFHDLRHSFIMTMVEQGIPLGVIQAIWATSAPGCCGTIRTFPAVRRGRLWRFWTASRCSKRFVEVFVEVRLTPTKSQP
jgi:integrase